MARRGPVGRGYMPKGGVKAAQAHNRPFQESLAAADREVDAKLMSTLGTAGKVAPVEAGSAGEGRRQGARQRAAVRWPSTVVLARIGAVSGTLAFLMELGHR